MASECGVSGCKERTKSVRRIRSAESVLPVFLLPVVRGTSSRTWQMRTMNGMKGA